jgi:hypothetical protein
MNTFLAIAYRDLACATAAALITLILSVTFVQSTSVPPGTRSATHAFVAMTPAHGWFGQPAPAVLVD